MSSSQRQQHGSILDDCPARLLDRRSAGPIINPATDRQPASTIEPATAPPPPEISAVETKEAREPPRNRAGRRRARRTTRQTARRSSHTRAVQRPADAWQIDSRMGPTHGPIMRESATTRHVRHAHVQFIRVTGLMHKLDSGYQRIPAARRRPSLYRDARRHLRTRRGVRGIARIRETRSLPGVSSQS